MTPPRKAVPAAPPPKPEGPPRKRYVVLSRKCVWGKKGETIELALSKSQEKSLIQAGVLEEAPILAKGESVLSAKTVQKYTDWPLKSAVKEDERHG